MSPVRGLHHVTAVASSAQHNLDFYTAVLGMRLVKKSVNQDDPGTYHLFYADGAGTPGSDLTFFPWAHLRRGRQGPGLATQVALAVPPGSLGFYAARLERAGFESSAVGERFEEETLLTRDPDGLPLALVEASSEQGFVPWESGPVPAAQQVRRIHAVRLEVDDLDGTVGFLADGLGFELTGEEDGWVRFVVPSQDGGSGKLVDVRASDDAPRGLQGAGTVHHVAFRVADLAEMEKVRTRVAALGRGPTPVIDRFWFRSVYFQEPGRVLFELATDGPGFSVDESLDALGERLVLPPWLESDREAIEARLPRLETPEYAG